jgi:hypothetical protein
MDLDDSTWASEMMTRNTAGRAVTRVLLDFSVTLQIWELSRPTVEIKLERPFEINGAGAGPVKVDPENLGGRAVEVAAILGAVVRDIRADENGVLAVAFEDGRTITAGPDSSYESWSFVSDDGGRVICTPGGKLAIWGPVA